MRAQRRDVVPDGRSGLRHDAAGRHGWPFLKSSDASPAESCFALTSDLTIASWGRVIEVQEEKKVEREGAWDVVSFFLGVFFFSSSLRASLSFSLPSLSLSLSLTESEASISDQ